MTEQSGLTNEEKIKGLQAALTQAHETIKRKDREAWEAREELEKIETLNTLLAERYVYWKKRVEELDPYAE